MKVKGTGIGIVLMALLAMAPAASAADLHLENNEKLLFGFKRIKSKKTLSVAMANNKAYIVYRYGPPGVTEFEFPKDKMKSFSAFTYSHYFRGGPGNAGVDLNYLRFTNDAFEYLIYDEYSADDDQKHVGVKVTNRKTKKTVDIKGDSTSVQGSLGAFRFMKGVQKDDYLPQ